MPTPYADVHHEPLHGANARGSVFNIYHHQTDAHSLFEQLRSVGTFSYLKRGHVFQKTEGTCLKTWGCR